MNTNENEKELVSSTSKISSSSIAAGAVFLFGGIVIEIPVPLEERHTTHMA